MLGFLRREGDPDDVGPQPRLDQIDALLESFADTGIDVQVSVSGSPDKLPASLEVSAYRILQEALTNVLKHSDAGRVSVAVRAEPAGLTIEVVDDGAATSGNSASSGGHGLIGMRERVALHRGSLLAGPLPTGGYRVLATFPLDGIAR
jgi:signal transduction histidine kinase